MIPSAVVVQHFCRGAGHSRKLAHLQEQRREQRLDDAVDDLGLTLDHGLQQRGHALGDVERVGQLLVETQQSGQHRGGGVLVQPLVRQQRAHLAQGLDDAVLDLVHVEVGHAHPLARQPRVEQDLVGGVVLLDKVLLGHGRVGGVLNIGQVVEDGLGEAAEGRRVGEPQVVLLGRLHVRQHRAQDGLQVRHHVRGVGRGQLAQGGDDVVVGDCSRLELQEEAVHHPIDLTLSWTVATTKSNQNFRARPLDFIQDVILASHLLGCQCYDSANGCAESVAVIGRHEHVLDEVHERMQQADPIGGGILGRARPPVSPGELLQPGLDDRDGERRRGVGLVLVDVVALDDLDEGVHGSLPDVAVGTHARPVQGHDGVPHVAVVAFLVGRRHGVARGGQAQVGQRVLVLLENEALARDVRDHGRRWRLPQGQGVVAAVGHLDCVLSAKTE